MLKNIVALERDQQADCARVENAVRMAESEIAFLETRPLHSDELQKRRSAIRDRTILAVRDVRQNMAKRAVAAKAAEQSTTDEFIRHDPGFSKDHVVPHLNAFVAMLERTPIFGSAAHLRKLIADGERDLKSILRALEAREDSRIYAAMLEDILAQLQLAGRARIQDHVTVITRSAERADAEITDLLSRAGYPAVPRKQTMTSPGAENRDQALGTSHIEKHCSMSSSGLSK